MSTGSCDATPSSHRHVMAFHAITLLILVLGTGFIYLKVSQHLFVYDTLGYVWENPYLREFNWENFQWLLFNSYRESWQPLTWVSHALDFALFGEWAGGHHLVNVGWHLLLCMLLYQLLLRLCSLAGQATRPSCWIAGFTSLIFAFHPLHVESVAMVYERRDMLYCIFLVLSFGQYLNYRVSTTLQAVRWKFYGASIFWFVAALLTKPMAITFPVLLILVDLYPLHRTERISAALLRRTILDKLPFFALATPVILITILTQGEAIAPWHVFPLELRVLNILHNISFFFGQFVLPLNLAAYYPLATPSEMTSLAFWLPGAVIASGLSLLGLWLWNRGQRLLMVLWLFFLVSYAPVSGFIHTGGAATADHFVYFSVLAHCIGVACLLTYLLQKSLLLKFLGTLLASGYLLMLVTVADRQVSHWRSPVSLWIYTLNLHPSAVIPRRNLALTYIQIGAYEEAREHIARLPANEQKLVQKAFEGATDVTPKI